MEEGSTPPGQHTYFQEPAENKIPDKGPRVINLCFENHNFPGEIRVRADELGQSKWLKALDLTQEDRKERGIEITTKDGEIRSSGIQRFEEGGYTTPPREILRQMIAREKISGIIHTHFFHQDTKAPTGTFSSRDIVNFNAMPKLKFIGVLDLGGIHILVKRDPKLFPKQSLPPGDFVFDIQGQVRNEDGINLDVMKKIANIADSANMTYYYTQNLNPDENGYINLVDVKTIASIPPRT